MKYTTSELIAVLNENVPLVTGADSMKRAIDYQNKVAVITEILKQHEKMQNPQPLKCEKCGHELGKILIGIFNHDGSDGDYAHPVIEYEENAAIMDTSQNWTGYELSEEEQLETICCPTCKQFPFISTEIQVQNIVRIICFKQPDDASTEAQP